jgi:hypothetical protein
MTSGQAVILMGVVAIPLDSPQVQCEEFLLLWKGRLSKRPMGRDYVVGFHDGVGAVYSSAPAMSTHFTSNTLYSYLTTTLLSFKITHTELYFEM